MKFLDIFKGKEQEKSLIKQTPEMKEIISNIVLQGDISNLSEEQTVMYYTHYCKSLGLNPITKPFDVLNLKGKTVLYANKDCAAQLRKLRGVCIDSVQPIINGDIYTVIVNGHDRTGKTDSDIAAVPIGGLKGESLCNAMMKATTKAKRRFTLSICGLGVLDETEIETIITKPIKVKDVTPRESVELKQAERIEPEEKKDTPQTKNKPSSTTPKIIVFVNKYQKQILAKGQSPSDIIKEAAGKTDQEIDEIIKRVKEQLC